MSAGRSRPEIPQAKLYKFGIFAAIFFMLFMVLTQTTFITIPAGHKGVMFKRFSGGMQKDKIYDQGFQMIAPWNDLIIYDVRTNGEEEEMDVLSKNGLNITVKLTFRYSPDPQQIGYLHDDIGRDYLTRIILPEIRSAVREVVGKYLPEELYSTKREAIQDEIEAQAKADANRILNASLSENLLRDKGIEATLELSKSPNSKVVIIGGADGLPLILGNN